MVTETFVVFIYIDAPLAITGDWVNRECYMQVRGRVHNSHFGGNIYSLLLGEIFHESKYQ